MPARIAGLGAWFPARVRRNADWPASFSEGFFQRRGDRLLIDVPTDEADPCRAIVNRHVQAEADDPFLGGEERRIADAETTSAEAEAWAAAAALTDAGLPARRVDAVFSWALVPDRIMPSNACRVAQLLGAEKAWTASVDLACASPVGQLELAAALVESGRARVVLLTQSHLASRTFALGHPASPCVGDGATALVVTASERPGVGPCRAVTHGEHHAAVIWRRDGDDPPWWEPGDAMHMGSQDPAGTRTLMRDTVPIAVQTVRELLDRVGARAGDVDALASVQPRRWIPEAIAASLGLPRERAPDTYRRYAHLGGAGAVANLIAAREAGLLRPGARVVLYAQGAGFTRGAVWLTF